MDPIICNSCIKEASRQVGLILAVLVAVIIYLNFYDSFWYPPDEGVYAHVAERVLNGERLNTDIHDIHFGYITLINAAALHLFGSDLISLRYPLVIIGLLQALLMFILFSQRGTIIAITASVSLSSLAIVQFLNPSANWYVLFLTICLVGVAALWRHENSLRLITLGLLAGLVLFVRQLSGVFVIMGLLTYLICEHQEATTGRQRALARLCILIMLAGTGWYIHAKADLLGWLIFGIWPMGILVWAYLNASISNARFFNIIGKLAVGGFLAAAPVLLYHTYHGSLGNWFSDTVIAAAAFSDTGFIGSSHYANLLGFSLASLLQPTSLHGVVNNVFWVVLILLTMVNGYMVLVSLFAGRRSKALQPLPILAVFYSLVSLHFQIPIYLFFSIGLTLASVLWLATRETSGWIAAPVAMAWFLSVTALYYHAGQPLSRGAEGILTGVRTQTMHKSSLPGNSLNITGEDLSLYRRIVAVINENTEASDHILALPANPEIYFMTKRKNPLRYANPGQGIVSESAFVMAKRQLDAKPPAMLVYKAEDKYNTPYIRELMAHLNPHYQRMDTIEEFAVYRRLQ
jgi:hypothetical protein